LQEQSEGVQALSVLALMAMQTAESRIVAIDEPETYLHPTAQRTLIAALLQGPTQRLLATHSSSVASAADPQEIIVFGADGRVRQLPAGAPIGAPLRLLRDWRQALVEPLTARMIVFVEGASDRILVEVIARLLGYNLDQWDVAVFQLDGSGGFGAAWEFFGAAGLDLPVRGICDDDAKDDWAGTVGVASSALSSHGFLVLQPDLEGYYVSALGPARVLELLRDARLLSDRQLLGGTGKTDPTQLTPDELAAACRRGRNKTAAAASLAVGMTVADAIALTMLVGFVGSLAP
jgi:putative ATP-dependent endonuclease of OLD family